MNSELKRDVRRVLWKDPDYPRSLKEVSGRPEVLYVYGRWPLPEREIKIGIVGSRHASTYGLQAADQLARELVRKNVVTVSGLALGIDAAAHRATLQEGGWTVAILGHGFDYQYPKENASLYQEIAQSGTLITEFAHNVPPDSKNFPRRNRIISGLSQGVVVVEAGSRSGALITARLAAEQGRDVFAVPGSLFAWQSQGCHRLIKEGARLVESATDILDEVTPAPLIEEALAGGSTDDGTLTEEEQTIMNYLSSTSETMDALVELTGLPVRRIAELLLALELKGRLQSLPGQRYAAQY